MTDKNTSRRLSELFGVEERDFLKALDLSPSAKGYISGAISEMLLMRCLETAGYDVIRIKEKPRGGNRAKNEEARGDFYIKRHGERSDKWLVVESKGLKSNAEFRGSKLDSPDKVYEFLKKRIFSASGTREAVYRKGHERYLKAKEEWENSNPGRNFPKFGWNKEFPGPETCSLDGIWGSEAELREWVDSLNEDVFTEKAYRELRGALTILETHHPDRRKGIETGIERSAPLICNFNIMAVDLFLRTGKHEFVFMNSDKISHSHTSPEHLYQNYTIDVLVKGLKDRPVIRRPWYPDIEKCINETRPAYRSIDRSQVDDRG